MIVNDNSDILLTFSWGDFTHGISGHLFECIDYYLLLKKHFKVKILIPEKINNISKIIQDKYNLSEKETKDILSNIILGKPVLVKTNNILFCDGGYNKIKSSNIIAKNKIGFACGDKTILEQDDIYVLLDYRVYDTIPKNSFNYKKKLYFDKYKKEVKKGSKTLIYATENCRLTDKELPNQLKLTKKDLPYLGLFDEIDSYLYTVVPRHFDCSSRLIPECKYYNKKVIFDDEVKKYFFEDKGLFFRYLDTKVDFDSLFLKEDDEIIDILKKIIKEDNEL